jgi:hypothetical protein
MSSPISFDGILPPAKVNIRRHFSLFTFDRQRCGRRLFLSIQKLFSECSTILAVVILSLNCSKVLTEESSVRSWQGLGGFGSGQKKIWLGAKGKPKMCEPLSLRFFCSQNHRQPCLLFRSDRQKRLLLFVAPHNADSTWENYERRPTNIMTKTRSTLAS